MVPSPPKQAEPASVLVLDPHKKRRLKILQRVIAPRGNPGWNRVHALAVEVEELSLADPDLRKKNATQLRFGAFAIVAHVPSGARSDLCQGSVKGLLQLEIVRCLPLPPCPACSLVHRCGTAGGLTLVRPVFG